MTRNTIIGSVWEKNQFVKPLEYTNMAFDRPILQLIQGLLYLDGRNSQKYLHQDQADF